jgi:hypothetical protein
MGISAATTQALDPQRRSDRDDGDIAGISDGERDGNTTLKLGSRAPAASEPRMRATSQAIRMIMRFDCARRKAPSARS